MKQLTTQDVQKLGHRLATVRHSMDEDLDAVKALYAGFDPNIDARITAISELHGTFGMSHLCLMFLYKNLMNRAWWTVNIKQRAPESDMQSVSYAFSNYSRMAFIQSLFSTVESSFRLLLRALDSSACNNGTSEFKSIYECLLKSKLSQRPPDSVALLDLLRLIRNSAHNNGVHFHRTGQDTSITWKGITYDFKHGFPIDFVNWDFCVTIADNVRMLMRNVVEDSNIQAINQQILDPFCYHTRNSICRY